MVNFKDPAVILADFCTYAVQTFGTRRTCLSFHRGAREALAHHRWSLHVPLASSFPSDCNSLPPILFSSWEFFTTLDYEWSVIQGSRPYRWTIWVCTEMHFWVSIFPCNRLIFSWYRCTPIREYLPFWP